MYYKKSSFNKFAFPKSPHAEHIKNSKAAEDFVQ